MDTLVAEKIIPLSKSKLLTALAGTLVFVALGMWMVISGDTIFERIFGIIGIAFFGLCGLFALRKTFETAPGLILNANGLVDNASAVAVGFIPWNAITGISVYGVRRQRFLVVELADPEMFANRNGSISDVVRNLNHAMSGSPVTIPSNSLQIAFDELVETVDIYLRKYGPNGVSRV